MIISKEDRAQRLSVSLGAPRRGSVFYLLLYFACRAAQQLAAAHMRYVTQGATRSGRWSHMLGANSRLANAKSSMLQENRQDAACTQVHTSFDTYSDRPVLLAALCRGDCAVLCCAVLCCAVLCCAVLFCAVLCFALLCSRL